MKTLVLTICLALTMPLWGQNAEVASHAPWSILLMSPQKGVEGVLPMSCLDGTHQKLKFVPISKIKDSAKDGCIGIRLGDVTSALAEATQTIQQLKSQNAALQAENEKLWKVAEKSNPQPAPPPVVVQQPTPSGPSKLEQYMLLRSMFPASKPYMQPMPTPPPPVQNPYRTRAPINCITSASGNTAYTNCN